MRLLFCFVLCFTGYLTLAQSTSFAIEETMDKAYQLEQSNPDSALLLYKLVQQQTAATADDLNFAKSLHYQGIVFSDQVQYDSADYYYKKAIEAYERAEHPRGIAAIYTNMANIAQFKSEYREAIEYYQKAIPIFKQVEDLAGVSRAENNLSNVLHELDMQDKAIVHAQKALQLAEELKDSQLMTDALHNLGSYVLALGDTTSAITYSQRSMKLAQANEDQYNLMNNYERLSNLYYNTNPQQALEYALAANRIAEAIHLPRNLCNTYASIGVAQYHLKQYDLSINSLQQAVAQSRELNIPYDRLRYLSFLQMAYAANNNFKEAHRISQQYNGLQDSIYDIERSNIVAELETKYQVEQTQRDLDNQTAISERERQNRIAWTLVALLLSLGLIGIVFWFRHRIQRNQLQQELQQIKIRKLEQERKVLTLNAMINGQEEERKRIAKDLHDSVGSLLSTVKLSVKNIQRQINLLEVVNVYERVNELIDHASEEVRRISHDMMPDVLKISLSEGLQELVQQLQSSHALIIQFEEVGAPQTLENQQKVMLYRIAQELTQNVVKHAAAQRILIQLIWETYQLQLIVEDDGIGFDSSTVQQGLGLRSIRSRVDYLGGQLDIDSEMKEGTSICVLLKL